MKIQNDNIIISQLTTINLENKVRLANLKLKDMTEIVNVMDRDVADIKVKQ